MYSTTSSSAALALSVQITGRNRAAICVAASQLLARGTRFGRPLRLPNPVRPPESRTGGTARHRGCNLRAVGREARGLSLWCSQFDLPSLSQFEYTSREPSVATLRQRLLKVAGCQRVRPSGGAAPSGAPASLHGRIGGVPDEHTNAALAGGGERFDRFLLCDDEDGPAILAVRLRQQRSFSHVPGQHPNTTASAAAGAGRTAPGLWDL